MNILNNFLNNLSNFSFFNDEKIDINLFNNALFIDLSSIYICKVKNNELSLIFSEYDINSFNIKNEEILDNLYSIDKVYLETDFQEKEKLTVKENNAIIQLKDNNISSLLFLTSAKFDLLSDEINEINSDALSFSNISSIILDKKYIFKKQAFFGIDNLKSVDIKEAKILSIPRECFANNYNLETIRLPDSLLYLGRYAFANCTSLQEIKIPDKVNFIDNHCFLNCKKLKTIYISNGIKYIGKNVFENCENLEKIIINNDKFLYLNIDYSNVKPKLKIYIPDNLYDRYISDPKILYYKNAKYHYYKMSNLYE